MKLILSLAAAALVLIAIPAHAITPSWSVAATACAVDADAVQFSRFTNTNGFVAHRTSNVDAIQLMCAINERPLPTSGTQWTLVATYRDSTGTAVGASVIARLIRVSRTTGGQTVVASFNSNTSAATAIAKGSIGFTHTFNFDTNYYYVNFVLDRTLSTETVRAVGAAIEPFIP